jgi:tRNA (guanine-N7-)-methyltransferase
MNSDNAPEILSGRKIRSYVRRQGRMSPAQKRCYETLFPILGTGGDEKHVIESEKLFGNSNPLIIEIGFGMGMATVSLAKKNPCVNYLGIEVHRPGIGRLLWEIEKTELKNIRILEGDAEEAIRQRIADNAVSAFHIFFPDPWPKKRHKKRRLVKRPFTDLLVSKLVPGAYIYMASDCGDYCDWALSEFSATPGLANKYKAFAEPQTWRPKTEFELKGLGKNHEIRELYFEKRKG